MPIKLKLLSSWTTTENLNKFYGKYQLDDTFELVDGTCKTPDYYVIFNSTNEFHVPAKSLVLTMEPFMEADSRWGRWMPPKLPSLDRGDIGGYKKILSHQNSYNNTEYHLSKTAKELLVMTPLKTKMLSTVLSDKYNDIGHVKRVNFVKFLEDKMPIDVFGSNRFKWKRYGGTLPEYAKDELFHYRYTFNAENNPILNYFTEKLIDGILSECLTFYWGCPNVEDYIDSRAFIRLGLIDFEDDCKIIETAIQNNEYEKRLPFIRQAKRKILTELQLFPRLCKILKVKQFRSVGVSILTPLYNGVEFLEECVKSVKAQTHENWELIIGVNGVSIESPTYTIAKTFADTRIRVIHYPTKGKPETMNAMVKDAIFDVICVLDVDDLFMPTKLEDQLPHLHSGYDVIGSRTERFGDDTKLISYDGEITLTDLLIENKISNCACMLRKENAHWNDEVLDDYELWLRLASLRKKFYNVPKTLCRHRVHSASFFNNSNNTSVEELKRRYKTNLTLVTCYYQIPSKFSNETYQLWISNFFANIQGNIIIFTNKVGYEQLKQYKSFNHVFVIKEMSDFYTSRYDDYFAECLTQDTETGHSVELYKVWNEKSFFLEEAMKTTTASYLYWIDIGCVREKMTTTFPNENRLKIDKIMLVSIKPFSSADRIIIDSIPLVYKQGENVIRIQGGFFGGSRRYLEDWIALYKKELELFVKTGTFGGKDQYVMGSVCIKNPSLINLVSYTVPEDERWFQFLKEFGKIDKSVIICGLVKNAEKTISENLKRMCKIAGSFSRSKVIIYENNSTDSTKQILNRFDFGTTNVKVISEDIDETTVIRPYSDAHPCRIELIKNARNRLVKEIREDTHSEYVVMIDLDGTDFDNVEQSLLKLDKSKFDVFYANGTDECGLYYDLYAIRIENLLYGPEIIGETFWNLPTVKLGNLEPIKVYSAFGGIGIFKKRVFDDTQYECTLTPYVKHVYRFLMKSIPDQRINKPCSKFPQGEQDNCLEDRSLDIYWKHNSGYKAVVICEHVCFNFELCCKEYNLAIDPELKYVK